MKLTSSDCKNQVAQSKSLFDDPADKIEELTGIIKMDIEAIRKKLQTMNTMVATQGRQSEQSATHSGVVMETLTGNLGETTLQFTKILEMRTEVGKIFEFIFFFMRLGSVLEGLGDGLGI